MLKFLWVRGEHLEVFLNGTFLFSADTMREAEEELREMGVVLNIPKPLVFLFAAMPYALSLLLLGAVFFWEEARPAYGHNAPAHTQSIEEEF